MCVLRTCRWLIPHITILKYEDRVSKGAYRSLLVILRTGVSSFPCERHRSNKTMLSSKNASSLEGVLIPCFHTLLEAWRLSVTAGTWGSSSNPTIMPSMSSGAKGRCECHYCPHLSPLFHTAYLRKKTWRLSVVSKYVSPRSYCLLHNLPLEMTIQSNMVMKKKKHLISSNYRLFVSQLETSIHREWSIFPHIFPWFPIQFGDL